MSKLRGETKAFFPRKKVVIWGGGGWGGGTKGNNKKPQKTLMFLSERTSVLTIQGLEGQKAAFKEGGSVGGMAKRSLWERKEHDGGDGGPWGDPFKINKTPRG